MSKSRFDISPVCCGVCKRQAWGIGYAPSQGKPVLWLCKNDDCLTLGETVFRMAQKKLEFHEMNSLHDAGDAAGAYLEAIGKTDLAALGPGEWTEFLKTILTTYSEKMRERLLSGAHPF